MYFVGKTEPTKLATVNKIRDYIEKLGVFILEMCLLHVSVSTISLGEKSPSVSID